MKLSKLDAIGKPYAIYADALDGNTIEQFTTAMQHESVLQGALMPDAHSGYSLPIGGVVLCKDMVFPSFVGYDIGCGVSTLRTTLTTEQITQHVDAMFEEIYAAVPTGVGKISNDKSIATEVNWLRKRQYSEVVARHIEIIGASQLGTLGSGNHFIEIGASSDRKVYITVHSGSRNLGHHVATHYMKLAANSAKAKEGVYGLAAHSEQGRAYLQDTRFCGAYAQLNRDIMIYKVCQAVCKVIGQDVLTARPDNDSDDLYINKAHNFIETKPGNLFLHRKGATVADRHTLGVIPGNMRDGVYVVEGLGNTDSMDSCSHGAGRTMSRAKAKDTIAMTDFTETMQGITAKVTEGTKDESPFAYKDFAHVMELQKDLAKIKFHIKPIINVKG